MKDPAIRPYSAEPEVAERSMGNQIIQMVAPFFVPFQVNTEKIPTCATDKIFGSEIIAVPRSTGGFGEPEIGVGFP